MLDLWLKILDIMDRLMNSGQGDNLEEAVPESLKNILLVMADGGFLIPPKQGEKPSQLWTETSKKVDRFLPGLVPDLFPDAAVIPLQSPIRDTTQETEPGKGAEGHITSGKRSMEETAQTSKQPSVETAPEDVD